MSIGTKSFSSTMLDFYSCRFHRWRSLIKKTLPVACYFERWREERKKKHLKIILISLSFFIADWNMPQWIWIFFCISFQSFYFFFIFLQKIFIIFIIIISVMLLWVRYNLYGGFPFLTTNPWNLHNEARCRFYLRFDIWRMQELDK